MDGDRELLGRYVREHSESAFAAIVDRYINLVFSVASRHLGGNGSQVEDVAQQVFMELARKAKSLGGREQLAGWLFATTRYVASRVHRSEVRRQDRDARAVTMYKCDEQDPSLSQDSRWLSQVLDESIGSLGEMDRDALVLRYYQGLRFKAIGSTLNLGENAARMRVDRALVKLQAILKRRGIDSAELSLGTLLTGCAVVPAPVGLALAVVSNTALSGGALSASAFDVILYMMNMTKIKWVALTVAIAAGVGAPYMWQERRIASLEQVNREMRDTTAKEVEALNRELEDYRLLAANQGEESALEGEELLELMRLRDEVGRLRQTIRDQQSSDLSSATNASESAGGNPNLDGIKWRAMDRNNSVKDRQAALRELRSLDQRSRDVVLAMIEWMPELEPEVRADVIRNLHGVSVPELKAPLLEALEDENHELRGEATETLDHYADDPEVRARLIDVAQYDPSDGVRYDAINGLFPQLSIAELQELAFNADGSEESRLFAAMYWEREEGPTEDTAAVLMDVFEIARDHKNRRRARDLLVAKYGSLPSVEEWMLRLDGK